MKTIKRLNNSKENKVSGDTKHRKETITNIKPIQINSPTSKDYICSKVDIINYNNQNIKHTKQRNGSLKLPNICNEKVIKERKSSKVNTEKKYNPLIDSIKAKKDYEVNIDTSKSKDFINSFRNFNTSNYTTDYQKTNSLSQSINLKSSLLKPIVNQDQLFTVSLI
jgi:hypothetical protein